jgi:hypothetical protein
MFLTVLEGTAKKKKLNQFREKKKVKVITCCFLFNSKVQVISVLLRKKRHSFSSLVIIIIKKKKLEFHASKVPWETHIHVYNTSLTLQDVDYLL